MTPVVRATPAPAAPAPAVTAVARGFAGRCPACGRGRLFGRFLKVAEACPACGTDMHHHRADDFPPYIVMFVVCHLVGYAIYVSETRFGGLDDVTHMIVWPAIAVGLCLGLIQPVKGAVVGLQYALGMHGFGRSRRVEADGAAEDRVPDRAPAPSDAAVPREA